MKRVYLDYASTTPLHAAVQKEMARAERAAWGNAGAIHAHGVLAKRELTKARERVARCLQVRAPQIIFTSGGTESNNLAIAGAIEARRREGVPYEKLHIAVSSIEHSSVRACAEDLRSKGVEVSVIPVNADGIIESNALRAQLRPNTVVVSLMHVNNEIGIVEPVRKAGALIVEAYNGKRKPLFHVDASQSPLYFDVSPHSFYADALTLDGHKMYGPKGVGVLYVEDVNALAPLSFGGGQEKGLRPGTEPVSLCAGMALSLEMAVARRAQDAPKVAKIRETLIADVKRLLPQAMVVAHKKPCSPHIVAFGIKNLDAEFAVLSLDARGFSVSSKSSCLSSDEGSFVLTALGYPELSRSTIRVSLGRETTRAEVVRFARALSEVVNSQL